MPAYEESLVSIKKHSIGKPVDEVRAEAEKAGWVIRVVSLDGKPMVGMCDVKMNRINVVVEGGKVTEVRSIG